MAQIERTIEIQAPLETVFAFITDIRNHRRAVPPQTEEELLEGGDIPLRLDAVVRMRARYGGIRWTLATRITAFDPPDPTHPKTAYFRDEQIHGPFALWMHDHRFEATSACCVRLTDRFTFAAPFGPLGRLVERLWLIHSMQRLLEYMQAAQKRLLETQDTKAGQPSIPSASSSFS